MSDPSWASPSDQSEPPPAPTGPPVPDGMPQILPPLPGAPGGPAPGYGPVSSPPPVGNGPDDATPMYYAMPDPHQNWGLNPNSGVRYEVLVPRPPRPATVRLALLLTYVGVAISMVYLVLNSIAQWQDRDQVVSDAVNRSNSRTNTNIDTTSIVRDSFGVVLAVVAVLWILAAAGLIVCAILTNRGRNGARITLSVLMGVLGLYQLCGAVSAGAAQTLSSSAEDSSNSAFSAFSASAANIHWWSYVGPSLLAVIALIVFVLLIIPPTNRYFSAGPGRRFAPGGLTSTLRS